MKKQITAFILASALALTVAGCSGTSPSSAWEYQSESTYPEAVGGVVTKYSRQGWEFVSMSAAPKPSQVGGTTVVLLFKRPGASGATNEPAVRSQVPDGLLRGLVAQWRFEGNGRDSVGHHDLVVGGAGDGPVGLAYAKGKSGMAMSQQGNTRSFQLPKTADIDFSRNFTLSVWLYREKSIYDNDAVLDDGSIYLAKRDASPWDSRMGVFIVSSDSRQVELVDNSDMGEPPLHTWFHVLVFRDGNTVGIKVNNEGSATVDVSGMELQAAPITCIGQQQAGYPWQGRLDELCIWNRALTSNEMAAVYNNGNGQRP